MSEPYIGYGKMNGILNELEDLKSSARLRANNLLLDDLTRARADAAAGAYDYCQLRLMTTDVEIADVKSNKSAT